jgi:hypothetical protein
VTISIAVMISDSLGQHHRRQLDEYGELRSVGYTLSPIEYRHVQGRDIPLDLDHERQVGSVEYLERSDDMSLWAVAVAHDDMLLTVHTPVYASAGVLAARDGTDIELRSLALTHEPAGLGLRPATIIPGDFRRSEVRCHWHNLTPSRTLFERAAEHISHRHYGDPIVIAGPVPLTRREIEQRHIPAWVDEYGRPLPVVEADGPPAGAVVEIRPGGPILSVR